MAKTLRTSGDYTVKAGAGYNGGAGTNTITLDARYVNFPGQLDVQDLNVTGTQTIINSQTLSIEDQFIEVNRNNSTAGTEDSGIFFNQGSTNHALLYYDAGTDEFQLGTTTNDATATEITDITLGQLKVATTPSDANHAASKSYVDAQVGGGFSLKIAGDDSTSITVASGQILQYVGGQNINTAGSEPDTITISTDSDLTNITSITSDTSNGDLTLITNGTGDVVINDTITFSGAATTPSATTVTKLYNKTAGGGGTGLYFINSNISSGTEGELISKKKATALAIALG